MSEPIILEDYIRDSEELDTTENYSLVLVRPTLVVEGVLVNYIVVNRVTGAYEYVAGLLPEARNAILELEQFADAHVGDTETAEVCH